MLVLASDAQVAGSQLSEAMKEAIKNGRVHFHEKYWKDISAEAKEVCAGGCHPRFLASLLILLYSVFPPASEHRLFLDACVPIRVTA